MKKVIIIYNLLLAAIITIVGILNAKNTGNLLISLAFLPIALYFTLQLFKKNPTSQRSVTPSSHYKTTKPMFTLNHPKSNIQHPKSDAIDPEILDADRQAKVMNRMGIDDANRRIFLKFIGTGSLSLFILSLFTKRAQAAFFGSIPGPGTVNLKNSAGQTIDPAEKQPTDGYEIAELDDTGTETYYGFIHQDGSWYITQESAGGSYRYVRGPSNFAASWAIKETLTYDTFDNVF